MARKSTARRKQKYSKSKSKKKPEKKHLVQKDGSFNGILTRDTQYRENARDWMKETGFYDDKIQIMLGISHQETYNKLTNEKEKLSYVNERIKFYEFDYVNKDDPWIGVVNFEGGGRPYGNHAHHILTCEIFYHKDWTAAGLAIVKECGYDINNEGNIIYLPTAYRSCFYHDLPNHCWGHDKYNKKVQRHTRGILDKVNEALALSEEECEKKKELMKELFDMLIIIEDTFYKYLINKGPGPLVGGL